MIKKLIIITFITLLLFCLVPLGLLGFGTQKAVQRRATPADPNEQLRQAEARRERLEEEKRVAQRRKDALPEWAAAVRIFDFADYISQYFINENGVLTIRLEDGWHYLPKQIRLQYAQNMWSIWAKKSSPEKVDSARIKLVDKNGNKVGGSGWLGGSDVKVND